MRAMLFATAALCAVSTTALADETIKARFIWHGISVQSQEIGDVDGHLAQIGHASGLVSYPDGSVGHSSFVSLNDYTKGTGQSVVYWNIGTADGSQVRIHATTSVTTTGNKSEFKGSGTIIGGTGKFAGAKGDISYTGERFSPIPAAGSEAYVDIMLNIKTGISDQAADAKAMLTKAVAAIKADREVALGQFNKGEGGFLQGDLYPFCYRMSDGKAVAGGGTLNGTDVRQATDAVGYPSGKEIYAAGLKPEGQITEVAYTLAKFGTTAPLFPKVSFVTRVDNLVCGVGYYK
jgi:hypothetical protein